MNKFSKLLLVTTVGYFAYKHRNPTVTWRVADTTRDYILPVKGSWESAGYDLAIPIFVTIPAHDKVKIPLNLVMHTPLGYYLSLQTRSGMSVDQGVILSNGTEGVIDSDYDGEIVLSLWNTTDQDITLEPGTRVAQMILKRFYDMNLTPDNPNFELRRSIRDFIAECRGFKTRGTGGFGSTGQ